MSINISIIVRNRIKQLNQYKAEGKVILNFGRDFNEKGDLIYHDVILSYDKSSMPSVSKDKVKPVFPTPPIFLPR